MAESSPSLSRVAGAGWLADWEYWPRVVFCDLNEEEKNKRAQFLMEIGNTDGLPSRVGIWRSTRMMVGQMLNSLLELDCYRRMFITCLQQALSANGEDTSATIGRQLTQSIRTWWGMDHDKTTYASRFLEFGGCHCPLLDGEREPQELLLLLDLHARVSYIWNNKDTRRWVLDRPGWLRDARIPCIVSCYIEQRNFPDYPPAYQAYFNHFISSSATVVDPRLQLLGQQMPVPHHWVPGATRLTPNHAGRKKRGADDLHANTAKKRAGPSNELVSKSRDHGRAIERHFGEVAARNVEVKARVQELEANIHELKTKSGRLETEFGILVDKNTRLEAKSRKLEVDCDRLEAKNGELEAQTIDLKTKSKGFEMKVSKLETENGQLEAMVNELEANSGKLGAKIDELETQNIELKTKSDRVETENGQLKARVSELEAELGRTVDLESKVFKLEMKIAKYKEWVHARPNL